MEKLRYTKHALQSCILETNCPTVCNRTGYMIVHEKNACNKTVFKNSVGQMHLCSKTSYVMSIRPYILSDLKGQYNP